MDLSEEWIEKKIQKITTHPKFNVIRGSAYYDVALLGKSERQFTKYNSRYYIPFLINNCWKGFAYNFF
jgi:hypothetical protein